MKKIHPLKKCAIPFCLIFTLYFILTALSSCTNDGLDADNQPSSSAMAEMPTEKNDSDDNPVVRELSDSITGYYNVMEYGAQGDGNADDTKAIKEAIAAAYEDKGVVYFPQGTYLITETIKIGKRADGGSGNLVLLGAGGRSALTMLFYTGTGNMFEVTADSNVYFRELFMVHWGQEGSIVSLKEGMGHRIEHCILQNTKGNKSDMVYFTGSYIYITDCHFANCEPEAYAIHNRSVAGGMISINSDILDCGFGGEGKGVLVDADEGTRPEGMKINRNMFLNTGREQVTVKCVLHIEIAHNMMDQCSGSNILIDPEGLHVMGLFVSDNYISPTQSSDGAGIECVYKNGKSLYQGNIADNMIAYGPYGIKFGRNVNGMIIDSNIFTDFSKYALSCKGTQSVTLTANQFFGSTGALELSDAGGGGVFIVKDNQLSDIPSSISKTSEDNFIIADNAKMK